MARILCLSDLWVPFPGGAERLMFNLARDLHHRPEHTVQVFTGYEAPEQFDGPPVCRRNVSLDPDGWQLIQLVAAAWESEVILTHHLYARTFRDQLVALGLPIVEVVLNGQRMPEAEVAVFISEWVAARGGYRLGDLVITPPAMPDVIASRHGDGIGFVKPIPHKGVHLVYALAQAMPDRRFVVLRGEWQTLEVLSDLPNVHYMGPVRDMADFYAECRLVLMPSLSEDAGTVAQEATLNGLPCISSNVQGLAETNAGGVQLDPTDGPAWVAAIRLLDNPELYDQVVQAQCQHLMATDHPAKLALLADRIAGL